MSRNDSLVGIKRSKSDHYNWESFQVKMPILNFPDPQHLEKTAKKKVSPIMAWPLRLADSKECGQKDKVVDEVRR